MTAKIKIKGRAFNKVLRIGTIEVYGPRTVDVFVKIEYTDDGRLSFSGVEGPRANGDAWGGCGQIEMSLKPEDVTPNISGGWSALGIGELLTCWRRWHLNDMRAGCPHQRAAGWENVRIDPKELPNCRANRDERGILAIWVYPPAHKRRPFDPETHPKGLLCKPCPTCGYEYGSKWLREEVPAKVLEWIEGLPDTDKTPAWV